LSAPPPPEIHEGARGNDARKTREEARIALSRFRYIPEMDDRPNSVQFPYKVNSMTQTKQAISNAKQLRRIPNGLTFRLKYFPEQSGLFGDEPRKSPLQGWERVFSVLDKNSLEQFASIIIGLLGWEQDHLYEFKVHNITYVDMGEPDCIIDATAPCVSCAIPLCQPKT